MRRPAPQPWSSLERTFVRKAHHEQWEDALAILQQAGSLGSDRDKLFASLRLSIDDLPQEEQTIFLDLACVLLGTAHPATLKPIAKYIWGHGADTRLENLASKSLIKLDIAGAVVMHDQLRDLGRAMVTAVQLPWQRSHLWERTALDTLSYQDTGSKSASACIIDGRRLDATCLLTVNCASVCMSAGAVLLNCSHINIMSSACMCRLQLCKP